MSDDTQVMCRYCGCLLGGVLVGGFVRWEECPDGEGCKADDLWGHMLSPPVVAKPVRPLRVALRYWRPKRLTLQSNPCVYAWLWWNF